MRAGWWVALPQLRFACCRPTFGAVANRVCGLLAGGHVELAHFSVEVAAVEA